MSKPMDRIVIEVESNSTDAVNGLDNLSKSLKKLQKITKTASGLDENGINKVEGLANALERLSEVGSGTNMAMTLRNLRKIAKLDFSNLSSATASIQEVASIVNSGGNTPQPAPEEPALSGSEDVPVGAEKVDKLNASLSRMRILLNTIGNWFKNNKTEKFFVNLRKGFLKITERARTFLKSLKRIAAYRAIRTILSAITNGFKEGVSAVYQYSKALGGTFAKSMDSIATSMNYLKSSLGAMAAPILNMLAPVIEQLTDKLINLINVLNQVFARLSGATTWTKAVKVQKEYAEATDAATEANKKLKGSFLGIDEITALKDNSSSDTNENPFYAFEEVALDTAKIDDTIVKLRTILEVALAVGVAIKAWDFTATIMKLAGVESGFLKIGGAVALIVGGLASVIIGIIDIVNNGKDLQNTLMVVVGILAIGAGIAILIGGWIPLVIAAVVAAIAAIAIWGDKIVAWLENFKGLFDGWITGIKDKVFGFFDNIIDKVKNFCPSLALVLDLIKNLVGALFDGVKAHIDLGITLFQDFVKIIKHLFSGDFKAVLEDLKGFFKHWWEGFANLAIVPINYLISCFEALVNFFIRGINVIIKGINKISFDVPDWVPGIGGKTFGFNIGYISEVRFGSIPTLAEGGQVENGQLFIAREAGAELVGNIGGKTSVANNDQIIEGISNGVREANGDVVSAIVAMAQQIIQSVRDKDTAIYLDGDKVSKSVTSAQNRTSRMYGV